MHCCYLLTPVQDKSGERTYVGYTTDPTRRIRQHNGELTMGAKRTRYYRPWRFVCVVMGLPSRFSGLSFEWAWQNPFKGRLTKDQMAPYERVKGFGRRGGVRRKLIELKVMLAHCKPFKDLGLNVCFGNEQDWVFFDKVIKGEAPLPRHIIVEAREIGACYRDLVQQQQSGEQSLAELVTAPEALVCLLCEESFVCGRPALQHATCGLLVHPVCLAREFLRSVAKFAKADADPVLRPQSGACPLCDVDLVWAELVRNAATILTTQTLTVASSAHVDEDAGVQQEQQEEEEEEEEEQLELQGEVFGAQGDDELEKNEDADARGEEYDAMNDDANVIACTNANSSHEIGVSEDPPLLA